ncbi:hypothetical protein AAVH_39027 [Aphelenchoides avenae]|nr:hypothetical protein AAVH_39027 [Aphelenchus avenae]
MVSTVDIQPIDYDEDTNFTSVGADDFHRFVTGLKSMSSISVASKGLKPEFLTDQLLTVSAQKQLRKLEFIGVLGETTRFLATDDSILEFLLRDDGGKDIRMSFESATVSGEFSRRLLEKAQTISPEFSIELKLGKIDVAEQRRGLVGFKQYDKSKPYSQFDGYDTISYELPNREAEDGRSYLSTRLELRNGSEGSWTKLKFELGTVWRARALWGNSDSDDGSEDDDHYSYGSSDYGY